MSTAENQEQETTTPADNLPGGTPTTPANPLWPRGVHSRVPKDLGETEENAERQMDERHAHRGQG